MSRVRRRRPKEVSPEPPACPTPDKHQYRSKADANRTQRRRQLPCGVKDHLHPYRCPCGAWHLTHQTPAEQQEIAERIAKAAAPTGSSVQHQPQAAMSDQEPK